MLNTKRGAILPITSCTSVCRLRLHLAGRASRVPARQNNIPGRQENSRGMKRLRLGIIGGGFATGGIAYLGRKSRLHNNCGLRSSAPSQTQTSCPSPLTPLGLGRGQKCREKKCRKKTVGTKVGEKQRRNKRVRIFMWGENLGTKGSEKEGRKKRLGK